MQVIEQIQEFFSNVPKPVIFAVVLLILIGGFFLWKKMSSKDNENEVEVGSMYAKKFAQQVADGLDQEREPMLSASAPEFVQEVQTGLQDLEKDVVGASTAEESEGDSDFEEF